MQALTQQRKEALIDFFSVGDGRSVVKNGSGLQICRLIVATTVILPTLSACNLLNNDPSFESSSYYVAGAGVSRLTPDTTELERQLKEQRSAGIQLARGFKFHSHLSAEVQVADLGNAELDPAGEIGYQMLSATALFYAPSQARPAGWSGFGRLGVGAMRNETSASIDLDRRDPVQFVIGAGIEYQFNNAFALRSEYIRFDDDVQYAQLALVFRIGSRGLPDSDAVLDAESDSDAVLDAESDSDAVLDANSDSDESIEPISSTDCTAGNLAGTDDALCCTVMNRTVEGVTFASGSTVVSVESMPIMQCLVRWLISRPDTQLSIHAHTDNREGSALSNKALSRDRALSIAQYLIDNGIDRDRLQAVAFGDSKPVAGSDTAQGRRLNRRIEFRLFAP